MKLIAPGHYEAEIDGITYHAFAMTSEYGDRQWVLDAWDGATLSTLQFDTLAAVRAHIAALTTKKESV